MTRLPSSPSGMPLLPGLETGVRSLPRVDYQFPSAPRAGALLAIVGEAPGADEVRMGVPFVGRSGQLLDRVLAAAGVARRACLVANVFRFQPPGNKVAHFFASRRRAEAEGVALAESWGRFDGSAFCRAEFAGEIEALAATLARLAPQAILTLGRTPLWALTGLTVMGASRGQVQPCRLVPGIPVVPTFHPSFLLRGQLHLEPTMREDIVQAGRLAGMLPQPA